MLAGQDTNCIARYLVGQSNRSPCVGCPNEKRRLNCQQVMFDAPHPPPTIVLKAIGNSWKIEVLCPPYYIYKTREKKNNQQNIVPSNSSIWGEHPMHPKKPVQPRLAGGS